MSTGDQPAKPTPEEVKPEMPPHQQSEPKKGFGLYEIIKTDDGGFEAILPSFIDENNGYIVGTTKKRFKTHEEATIAIERSKKEGRVRSERRSLEKSFTPSFFRIDKTEEGKFKVTLPGLVDSKTGYYVGTYTKEFTTWDEAKAYYLKSLEEKSRLTKQPILELKVGDSEQVAFSAFESFDPKVAPANKPKNIPTSVEKYILQKEKMVGENASAYTYQETIKKEGWEKELFSFVSDYLKTGNKKIAEELNIEKLDLLTPRQAVELSTRIVVELTKYKWSDVKDDVEVEHTKVDKKTQADKSTTLELLKEGVANKNRKDWEGNGVCRNFASMTKAIFEALKANQTRFNQLQNTYSLYEEDMGSFDPKRDKKNVLEINRSGHAWNTFVTISENAANATIVDTTWAKEDLATGKVAELDYTLTRMEPVIHQISLEMQNDNDNEDKNEQLEHVLAYYQLKMETTSQTPVAITPIDKLNKQQREYYIKIAHKYYGQKYDLRQINEDQLVKLGHELISETKQNEKKSEEDKYFVGRVIELLRKQQDIPKIPPALLSKIGTEYLTLAEESDLVEIETLWRVNKVNPGLPFRKILKKYLENKELSEYHSREFISYDDDLQREIFEQIKTHPKFEDFMENSPRFRIRMREVVPELFIDFSPGSKKADAKELQSLIRNSKFFKFARLFNVHQPSMESTTRLFAKVRKTLQNLNPEMYEQIAGSLDDYHLIKNYDLLYLKLTEAK